MVLNLKKSGKQTGSSGAVTSRPKTGSAFASRPALPYQSAMDAFGGIFRSGDGAIDDDWMADIREANKSLRGNLEYSTILATVSAAGRITLPREVRDAMDLSPGDRLRFDRDRRGFLMTALRDRKTQT